MRSSSSSSARLLRSVFRSSLRFARSPAIVAHGFRIDPIISFDLSPSDLPKPLSDKLLVESGAELSLLVKHLFNTQPPSSANFDSALDALRKLNVIHADIREKYTSREANSSIGVLQHRVMRVGQVVQHKESGTRALVIGWTVDEATGEQFVNTLLDQLDSQDLLRHGDPMLKKSLTKLSATLFTPVTDPSLLRIYNESVPLYFTEFDQRRGVFVPNDTLRFTYPLDHEPSGLDAAELVEVGTAAERVTQAVIRIAREIEKLALQRGIVPIPIGGNRDPVLAGGGGSSSGSSGSGSNIGKPILQTANEISSLILDDVLQATLHGKQLEREVQQAGLDGPKVQKVSANALSHLSSLFSTADQLLQLRFQHSGIGAFEEAVSAKLAQGGLTGPEVPASQGSAVFVDDSILPAVTFRVGSLVRHKKFGYRGVVAGFDLRPLLDVSGWEGVVGLPSGGEQPFYRVVPDEGDVERFLGSSSFRASYYCAQENLEPLKPSQGGDSLIRHRHIPLYFQGYDVDTNAFRVPHKLRFCFPPADEATAVSATSSPSSSAPLNDVERLAFADAEKLLVDIYAMVKRVLLQSRLGGDEEGEETGNEAVGQLRLSDLLLLLQHARRREDALVVEGVVWLVWMAHADSSVSRAMRQGVSNMKRGRTGHAFEAFNLASALDPLFAEPHNKIAALHHKIAEHAQCAHRAKTCLDLFPQHYGALAGMGMSLEKSGDIDGAVAALRKALQLHPFAAHVPTVLNSLLLELKETAALEDGSNRPEENKPKKKSPKKRPSIKRSTKPEEPVAE